MPDQPKKEYTPEETAAWNREVRLATINADRKAAQKTANLIMGLFNMALDAYKLPGTSKATRQQLYVYKTLQRQLLTHTRTADVEFVRRWEQSLVSRGLREAKPKRPVVRDGWNLDKLGPREECDYCISMIEHIHLPPKDMSWKTPEGEAKIAAIRALPDVVQQVRLKRKLARARGRRR